MWRVQPIHRAAQTKLNATGKQALFSGLESFQGYCWKNKPTSYSSAAAIKQGFLWKESLPLFGSQKMSQFFT